MSNLYEEYSYQSPKFCKKCGSEIIIKVNYDNRTFNDKTGEPTVYVQRQCPNLKPFNGHYRDSNQPYEVGSNDFGIYVPLKDVPPKPIVEQSLSSLKIKYGFIGILIGSVLGIILPWWIILPITILLIWFLFTI